MDEWYCAADGSVYNRTIRHVPDAFKMDFVALFASSSDDAVFLPSFLAHGIFLHEMASLVEFNSSTDSL